MFIVAIGCSGAAPAPPQALPLPRPPVDAGHDAPAPPTPKERGGSCTRETGCAPNLMCLPLPGGYCTSPCGVTGAPCTDGTCVATARAGEMCLTSCTTDAECRADEGYVCDPQWKACSIPNTAAIVPKQCPLGPVSARDAAFDASTALSTASMPGIYQFEPAAALTTAGDVFALFISRGSIQEGNRLGSAIVGRGKAEIDRVFNATEGNRFDPWLARDLKGTLHAVWLDFEEQDKGQQIAFASSTDDGRTWSAPSPVHEPGDCTDGEADCLDKPMIAAGPDPARKGGSILYVMYAAGDGLRVRASRDRGKTWSTAVTALIGIFGNATVGADGRLHIITLNGGPQTGAFGSASHKVEYTVSSDGARTFSKPRTISMHDEMLPFFFANPGIAVDTRRKWLYAAYVRGGRDAVWDIVIAASKDNGKTWKRTRIGDDPKCAIHMVPNLALDPTTGTLHVAWYDSRGTIGRFAHATCTVGAKSCKQVGAINDTPFAALSTVRHGAQWIGEYESLLVDDKRRMLHAVWSQPVDEGGKIVSRVFHASAKLPKR